MIVRVGCEADILVVFEMGGKQPVIPRGVNVQPRDILGSGLIDQSQKMTVAAMQMADMKVCAQRS